MNGYQRVLAMIEGRPVDHLPNMPITMMFAADQIGQPYGRYARDYRVMVEGQLRTAEAFGFDYVSSISDPAREAADCGATIQYYDDQPRRSTRSTPSWPTNRRSPGSKCPTRSAADA